MCNQCGWYTGYRLYNITQARWMLFQITCKFTYGWITAVLMCDFAFIQQFNNVHFRHNISSYFVFADENSRFRINSWASPSNSLQWHSGMNQCIWMNRLNKWINDSHITCFILEWIIVVKRIDWVNVSITQSYLCYRMNQCILTSWLSEQISYDHKLFCSWINQCISTNQLSEWINDSPVKS